MFFKTHTFAIGLTFRIYKQFLESKRKAKLIKKHVFLRVPKGKTDKHMERCSLVIEEKQAETRRYLPTRGNKISTSDISCIAINRVLPSSDIIMMKIDGDLI